MRTLAQLIDAARRWPEDERMPISLRELRVIQGYLFPASRNTSPEELVFHGRKLEVL